MSRCEWKDAQGVQCPGVATVSRSTNGEGAGFCRLHIDCRSEVIGRAVIDELVLRGEGYPLTEEEAEAMAKRVAGRAPGRVLDVQSMLIERRQREKAGALAFYRETRLGYEAGGMSRQRAHEEAIMRLWEKARADLIGLPDQPLTPADRRAGEVG